MLVHAIKENFGLFENDVSNLTILPVDIDISRISLELLRKYVLSHKLTVPDALIAATALVFSIPIYTLNVKDFVYIKGLLLYGEK